MKFEYIDTNGIKLHVTRDGPESGPLVLLLHGFPQFWYCWRHQIPSLTTAGFHVMAPDQRGYNLSDKPHGTTAYNLDELARDVIGLIEAAGREKAIVVGHDWGGAVAWFIACKFPERVEKLGILNVPHPLVMKQHLRKNFRQILRSWYMFFFQLPVVPEFLTRSGNWMLMRKTMLRSSRPGTFSQQDFDEYRKAWEQPGAITSMIHWYRALFRRKSRIGNPRVAVPTLFIWGARDRFLGKEMAQGSIALCDNGKLVLFENNSHWIQEEEPEKVTELILNFIG